MEKAPAFQFYPKDFLTDERVVLMSNTEIGIYTRLLCFCWLEGTLPLEMCSLASMARMPLKQFTKLWERSVLRSCFRVEDGRMHHKRLDEERGKQDQYRRRQSDNGQMGGRPKKAPIEAPVDAQEKAVGFSGLSKVEPKKSSPISYLQSPSPPSSPSETQGRRGEPPLALGLNRFKVWRWMLDDCIAALGPYADTFELDLWLQVLDAKETRVIPQAWPWLKNELMAEAQRRGLPIAGATPAMGKQTSRLAAALATIKAEGV